MSIKTYRAKSLQEAITLIRDDLGPDASVLHTREVNSGLLGRLMGSRRIEVAASVEVQAPSRFQETNRFAPPPATPAWSNRVAQVAAAAPPAHLEADYRDHYREAAQLQIGPKIDVELDLPTDDANELLADGSEAMFAVFTDLIEADVDETLARRVLDDLRRHATTDDLSSPERLRAMVPSLLEERFKTTGPINVQNQRRLVALVGPTGVGKTTTIAKLAANFRLREGLRVGLITVDTYRVAAVEQLRTYADIIDLPMEVVSTPREMREAVDRLSNLDLILLDTAGRSPRDEVQLQELKSMLSEAKPDEVHLVLSSTAGVKQLAATADRFKSVGVTSLLLTKLDEAAAFGHLLSLVDNAALPVSYTTNGQDVPDDIAVATPASLANLILA